MKKLIYALAAVLFLSGCAGSGDDSKIIYDPDHRLRKTSSEVQNLTKSDLDIIANIKEELQIYEAAGLAAPQIGVNKRIIVINDIDKNKVFAMVNPQIISSNGQTIAVESCLSIQGLAGIVKRSDKIKVKYIDENGNQQNEIYSGSISRTIQQKIDYLNGILFYDRADHMFNDVNKGG